MATWNSRGLRGSFLEELVNMTNDKYRSQKLALVQKVPTPIKPITIDRQQDILRLLTLNRKVRWITSGLFRGFRYVLMRRNVRPIGFHLRMCMNIRFAL